MKSISLFFSSITVEKGFLLLLTPFITIMLGTKMAALGLVIVITIDFVTGVKKYLYVNKIKGMFWEKHFRRALKSELMRNTWQKAREYSFGIVAIAVIDGFILHIGFFNVIGKPFDITSLAIAVAAVIELWSIYENIEDSGGSNLLKKLLSFLPKEVKEFFTKIGNKSEQE